MGLGLYIGSPKEYLIGKATKRRVEEDNQSYWMLECQIASVNSLCILRICFQDEKEELPWAIDTFQSIQR